MYTTKDNCAFCIPNDILRCNVLYEDDLWYITDMVDGELKHGYMLITRRHIQAPFEINAAEWTRLRGLLKRAKAFLDEFSSDGDNLGWNINPVAG